MMRNRVAALAPMQTFVVAGRVIRARTDRRPWYEIMRAEQRREPVTLARVRFLEHPLEESEG